MKQLFQPYQLGNLKLANPIFYAPLAGCSDFPFRKMSSRYRPGLMFCEMVKMDALIRHDPHTFHLLDYSSDMHPIGAQICGSNPAIAGQAARIVEELGFALVDLNCGCPVDKVTKDGSGSGMLKNPHLIGEVVANMVAAVKKIPVTVKIRIGWNDKMIVAEEVVKIVEQAGAKAICIHGRTREQGYRGAANWDTIKACVETATQIKVIGNGDVIDGPSAEKMLNYTGCDAVLVGRGTMGQPWIVEDILRHLNGTPPLTRTLEDCRQALLDHFIFTQRYHQDRRVCVDMRRVGCWYLKKSSGTRQFRELISRAENIESIHDLILNFPLGEIENGETEPSSDIDCCQ